jgi:hypothetical protein
MTRRLGQPLLDLEDAAIQWLCEGQPTAMNYLTWNDSQGNRLVGLTPEQAWALYGEDFLRTWVEVNPGSRPFAWWKFTAPEPLRDGEDQADYLTRFDLWEPGELSLWRHSSPRPW